MAVFLGLPNNMTHTLRFGACNSALNGLGWVSTKLHGPGRAYAEKILNTSGLGQAWT